MGRRAEKAGAVSQSFKAEAATPTQVLDFYARRLKEAGWDVVEPVHELGAGTVRGRWAEPKWMLTVSASAAPTLPAPSGAIQSYSQYSLSLRPAEVPSTSGSPEGSATPAAGDTSGFVVRNFKVTPVRDYDPIPDETAFSWELTGDGPPEYVRGADRFGPGGCPAPDAQGLPDPYARRGRRTSSSPWEVSTVSSTADSNGLARAAAMNTFVPAVVMMSSPGDGRDAKPILNPGDESFRESEAEMRTAILSPRPVLRRICPKARAARPVSMNT